MGFRSFAIICAKIVFHFNKQTISNEQIIKIDTTFGVVVVFALIFSHFVFFFLAIPHSPHMKIPFFDVVDYIPNIWNILVVIFVDAIQMFISLRRLYRNPKSRLICQFVTPRSMFTFTHNANARRQWQIFRFLDSCKFARPSTHILDMFIPSAPFVLSDIILICDFLLSLLIRWCCSYRIVPAFFFISFHFFFCFKSVIWILTYLCWLLCLVWERGKPLPLDFSSFPSCKIF